MRADAIDTCAESPFAQTDAEQNAKPTSHVVDAGMWCDVPDEPDDPLVAGFIECGEVFAIVGQAKAGKSLLALQMAVCRATGIPFLGRDCARRKVYVANLEVSERQYKKRLRRICPGLGVTPADLRGRLFIDNLKGETATWEMSLSECRAQECDVAIVDPFYQIAHIAETDETQCLEAVEDMKTFTRAGITLGVVFHSPKGFSGDRQLIDMISGSSILARFPESVIGLLNHATEKSARVVDAVLRNYAPSEPFAVSTSEGMLELAPDIVPDVATARNAWKRQRQAAKTIDLAPFVMKVINESEQSAGADYKGIPIGVLADKARKAYIAATGEALGLNRMPTEIKTLAEDGKIILTRRIGKGGKIYAGTADKMEWWFDSQQPASSTEREST